MSEILMPRLSDTMEEGIVSSWHKKPGDTVNAGDVIADIETDKAVMEYEAYEAGVLEKILVGEGETASIGAPIAVLATAGAAPAGAAPAGAAPVDAAPEATPPVQVSREGQVRQPAQAAREDQAGRASAAITTSPAAVSAREAGGTPRSRPPSSPLARRLAREHGVDLAALTGSGPGGRVVRADVDAAVRATAPVPAGPAAGTLSGTAGDASGGTALSPAPGVRTHSGADTTADVEKVPLSRFRKVTARRLADSMRTAPHFYLTRQVEVEELLAFRATLNTAISPDKVSVNDLIVKACASALRAYPALNVSFAEEHLLMHHRVHVGVAVALEDGLLVPVIRDTDRKSVTRIAAEARDLAGRARKKKLTAEEMSGGTFTVSNLGMLGVDQFTAVINPPEAAILAVGAIRQEAVVHDGAFAARNRMTLTLSVDHRACDGATGATFLGHLVDLLENPLRIIA